MSLPFPAYTVADFMKEVVTPYQVRTGGCGNMFCTLPISKYISLCDDMWGAVRFKTAINNAPVPSLDELKIVIPSGIAYVEPSIDPGIRLNHIGVLHELAVMGLGPEVEIGPYRYWVVRNPIGTAVAIPAANAFPTTVFGSWQQPPGNLTPPQAAADPEPPCHCDSHKLATVGHDEYCTYILWKRGRK